eukprot:m.27694 g.27694  ORF g.27694 m.27694 type:complete len:105 (-) comp8611_c0_seq2:191-505(-)
MGATTQHQRWVHLYTHTHRHTDFCGQPTTPVLELLLAQLALFGRVGRGRRATDNLGTVAKPLQSRIVLSACPRTLQLMPVMVGARHPDTAHLVLITIKAVRFDC